MSYHYRKLLAINFAHDYYKSGVSDSDFVLQPSRSTQKRLDGLGLIYKSNADGHLLFYRAREEGGQILPVVPASDMADGDRLTFHLLLQNPYFLNFTDITLTKPLRESVLYFNSNGGVVDSSPGYPASLELPAFEELTFRGPAFSVGYELTGNPQLGQMQLLGPDGQVVQTVNSELDEQDAYTASFEMGNYPAGRYLLRKLNAGTPEGADEAFYWSPEVSPGKVFGVLDIEKDSNWEDIQTHNETPGNHAGIRYDLSFQAKFSQWRYKIIFRYTECPADPSEVEITENFVSIPNNRYHALEATDKFFFKRDGTTQSFNGDDMLVFKSVDDMEADKAYPLYQESKHHLTLKVSGVSLLTGLPNPDIKNGTTDLLQEASEVLIYV